MVNRPKNKGTAMETWTARYLSWALNDPRIDRMALHGANDQGDITGVYFHGEKVCIEVKNTKKPMYREHWEETEAEMGNMDAQYAVLIQHRPGYDYKRLSGMADQMAIMPRWMLKRHVKETTLNVERAFMACASPIKQTDLVWIRLEAYALILNLLQPLGPEEPIQQVVSQWPDDRRWK